MTVTTYFNLPPVSPARRCKLTGAALPPGSTARREYATDRARVLAGKLRDMESLAAELDALCVGPRERAAVRSRLWRAGNLVRVTRGRSVRRSPPDV